ncbi:MAG: hypothetical protein ACREPR_23250, partial [Brasilonema sp.]
SSSPYPVRVPATKSTHLEKVYYKLQKIDQNTHLKPFPCKPSTHLNEKYRVSAISGDASMNISKLPFKAPQT